MLKIYWYFSDLLIYPVLHNNTLLLRQDRQFEYITMLLFTFYWIFTHWAINQVLKKTTVMRIDDESNCWLQPYRWSNSTSPEVDKWAQYKLKELRSGLWHRVPQQDRAIRWRMEDLNLLMYFNFLTNLQVILLCRPMWYGVHRGFRSPWGSEDPVQ